MTMDHLSRSFAVSIHFHHPTIEPTEISVALQLDPWRSSKAGPPKTPPYDQAYWAHCFDCNGVRDLIPFLEGLVTSLQHHREFFADFVDSGGAIELFCGVKAESNWDELLPALLLQKLGTLSVDLRLDVYPQAGNIA